MSNTQTTNRQRVFDRWTAAYQAWEDGVDYSPSADDLLIYAREIDPVAFAEATGETIYNLQCDSLDLDEILDTFYPR